MVTGRALLAETALYFFRLVAIFRLETGIAMQIKSFSRLKKSLLLHVAP